MLWTRKKQNNKENWVVYINRLPFPIISYLHDKFRFVNVPRFNTTSWKVLSVLETQQNHTNSPGTMPRPGEPSFWTYSRVHMEIRTLSVACPFSRQSINTKERNRCNAVSRYTIRQIARRNFALDFVVPTAILSRDRNSGRSLTWTPSPLHQRQGAKLPKIIAQGTQPRQKLLRTVKHIDDIWRFDVVSFVMY